jgi:hypothetical protein
MFDNQQIWGGYNLTPETIALPAWYRNIFRDMEDLDDGTIDGF